MYVTVSEPTSPMLMQVLKGCKKLAMTVRSMGQIPGGYITNFMYSWVDRQGRSVSPPPHNQGANQRQGQSIEERTVRIVCEYECGSKQEKKALLKNLMICKCYRIQDICNIFK